MKTALKIFLFLTLPVWIVIFGIVICASESWKIAGEVAEEFLEKLK